MKIGISSELILVSAILAICWLSLSFWIIPRSRRRLAAAESTDVPTVGGFLAFATTLRGILSAACIASLITLLGFAGLRWWATRLGTPPDDLVALVDLRDRIEALLSGLLQGSLQVWIVALVLLSVIWLMIARSGSRRRWKEAVDARHKALAASFQDLDGAALRSAVETADAAALKAFDDRIDVLKTSNLAMIEQVRNLPIVQSGDDEGARASISSLEYLEEELRQGPDDQPPADDAAASADLPSPEDKTKAADAVRAQIDELEKMLDVQFQTLAGDEPKFTLDVARNHVAPTDIQIADALRDILVETRMKNHDVQSLAKARREPELMREWAAAGATSEATVSGISWAGRLGASAALIAFFLGFVGLGAKTVGPVLVQEAKAIELTVLDRQGSDLIRQAAAADDAEKIDDEQSELASDEQTAQRLQQAFRSSASRALMQNILNASSANRSQLRRQLFNMSAIEARRDILRASSRPAASAAHAFEVAYAEPPSSARLAAQTLDDSIDRRIRTLRANEDAWLRLRAWAAKPATPDYTANAILRTAFGHGDFPQSHSFVSWSDRASNEFASDVAKNGRPSDANLSRRMAGDLNLVSAHDRRIFNGFISEAPQRFDHSVAQFRSGAADPGSLHRVVPGAGPRPGVPSGGRVASVYGDLFPAAASNVGGGSGGRSASSVGTPSSRSFSRVRFSGRVGGVVIGREPDEGGVELDVTAFSWLIDDEDQLYVELGVGDGQASSVTIGPFHPAIAHHALAYAADGRVVTSTLPQPTGDGGGINVQARRVAVHPAFEDTAFACRAIQIDRFVDGFTNDENGGPATQQIADVRSAVTSLGQVLSIIAQTYPDDRGDLADQFAQSYFLEAISGHAKTCGTNSTCFPIDDYQRLGFDFGSTAQLLNCFHETSNPAECAPLIVNLQPSTTFLVDSGVREVAFLLDEDLNFLTGHDRAGDDLWPLDFMIQAVPQTVSGQDVRIEEGWEPWRFATIEPQIRQLITQGIDADANAKAVLDDMKQFVIMQRLFRLALNGNLGLGFPLAELAALQENTRPFIKIQQHERWNVNQSFFDVMYEQEAGFVAAFQEIADSPGTSSICKGAIQEALAKVSADPWPNGEGLWPVVDEIDEMCESMPATDWVIQQRAYLEDQDLLTEAIHLVKTGIQPPYFCGAL